jgi:predicted CXXCH cytochrome family protein
MRMKPLQHLRGMRRTIGAIRALPSRVVRQRWARLFIAAILVLFIIPPVWWVLAAGGRAPAAPHHSVMDAGIRALPPPAPRPDHIVAFADGCTNDECHASIAAGIAGARLHEPVARHACDACHAPDAGGHTFPLLRTGAALCSHCHESRDARFQHKAIADTGCTACHDPHASRGRFLLIGETIEATCARCHQPDSGEHRHAPYVSGQCESCHEPHGSETRALLRTAGGSPDGTTRGAIESHCALCHADAVASMAAAPYSHRDAERSCLACHSAHTAAWKHLQRLEPRRGCTECHGDVGATIASARISHDAVLIGSQCASCHEPHASSNAMMLRRDHAPVCLTCHSRPLAAADGRTIPDMTAVVSGNLQTHGVVAAGECAGCHSVHGGQHARLLKGLNSAVLIGSFDISNYALCFSCHDPNLALGSGEATAFRDGDINLHRVHLQAGEQSRSCAACHAVHSSNHPRLIAETVPFQGSSWKMAMGFSLTPDGGMCAPGCHEPSGYARTRRNGPGAPPQ